MCNTFNIILFNPINNHIRYQFKIKFVFFILCWFGGCVWSQNIGDVLDLAWSPQDQWLASCSVDNNVIIWDANDFPTIVKILKGHSGLVKGVSWDPVNIYHYFC